MKRSIVLMSVLLLLTACSAPPAEEAPAEPAAEEEDVTEEAEASVEEAESQEMEEEIAEVDEELKTEVVENYANIVFASYEDSLAAALDLQTAVDAFIAEPSEETHQAAKDAWLAAQEPYGQTEVYRFYGGPIDDEDGPEGRLNAWPLDEAYVDYVEGNPDAGIINDPETYPEITAELLVSLNEEGAEENISIGYHAIEFLLWGQDLSGETNGQRSYTDYVIGEGQNAERRAQYLKVATDRLIFDLQGLVDEWNPDAGDNYYMAFVGGDADEAIGNILTGMGVLAKSELAGERMFVAYDNQDQEDEHSCFSDNTHRDIITNYQGIYNVWVGEYTRLDGSTISGPGISEVIATADPALQEELGASLDLALQQTEAIFVPFDQAIVLSDERPDVLATVDTLQTSGDQLALAGSAIGLTINTALPE